LINGFNYEKFLTPNTLIGKECIAEFPESIATALFESALDSLSRCLGIRMNGA